LQAVYAGSETIEDCLAVQKRQYDELVEFVASTVAANESAADMVQAQHLRDKKRRKDMESHKRKHPSSTGGSMTPPEQDTMFASHRCRRWPIVIAGDFNCNSRPAPGDISTRVTRPYRDLSSALEKIGPFSDILYDNLGEHPVTYAAADFSFHGSFSPRETALTSPEDYHESGEFVNQSLDYIFLLPPTHEEVKHSLARQSNASPMPDGEMSPDSRLLNGSIARATQASVDHLQFILPSDRQNPYGSLKYLSDHFAVEATLSVSSEY
jgi:endonuclease/exonuclease/phosphatase family metal-dependent hydrolase